MKRLTTLSFTLMALVLMSELATAQRGGGRSGSPAGPPPMSERGQMQNRSSKPVKETKELGSVESRDTAEDDRGCTPRKKHTSGHKSPGIVSNGNRSSVGLQRV